MCIFPPVTGRAIVLGALCRCRTITMALIGGGAAGPWLAGGIHDATGSYRLAFVVIIVACVISAAAIWMAAPRKVRRVPGHM